MWISVKDRLPEKYQEVLIFIDQKVVYTGEYWGGGKWKLYYRTGFLTAEPEQNPTHWMPLPPPPGEEQVIYDITINEDGSLTDNLKK